MASFKHKISTNLFLISNIVRGSGKAPFKTWVPVSGEMSKA